MTKNDALRLAKRAAKKKKESYVVYFDGEWCYCSYNWWSSSTLPQYAYFINEDGRITEE